MSVNNLLIKLKQEGYRVETQPNEEIEGTNKLIITKGEDSYYEELYKGLLDGSLTSFKVPAGVTKLASHRFNKFSNLKSVDLTGITEINEYLCSACYNIETLILDPNITRIWNYAFNDVSKSTSNTFEFLPIKECYIGACAFYQSNISKLKGTFTYIGASCFNQCYKLEYIDITVNGIISSSAFYSCNNVNYFRLNHESIITSLDNVCFRNFGNVRESPENNVFEFDFRNSIFETAKDSAFAGTSSGSVNKYFNIQFPTKLSSVKGYCFQYTDHFNIYFNSPSVPTIQSNTFSNMTNNKIFVPYNSINTYKTATNWTTVADSIYGFVNENTLEAGYVLPTTNDEGLSLKWYSNVDMTNEVTAVGDTTIKYYCKINTVVNTPLSSFEIDGNTITKFVGSETDVVIPSSYSIDGYTPNTLTFNNTSEFEYYCETNRDYLMENSIECTSVPLGVTVSINYNNYRDYLSDEYFPVTATVETPNIVNGNDYIITNIKDGAFRDNKSLQSVVISENVTSVGYQVFSGCTALMSITIPNSVTSIEQYAFYECTSLHEMTIQSTTPPALSNTNAISTTTTTIYIPHGTLSAYQSATNWSSFASKFVELNEDGSIPA